MLHLEKQATFLHTDDGNKIVNFGKIVVPLMAKFPNHASVSQISCSQPQPSRLFQNSRLHKKIPAPGTNFPSSGAGAFPIPIFLFRTVLPESWIRKFRLSTRSDQPFRCPHIWTSIWKKFALAA